MKKAAPKRLDQIFTGRQPNRPHFVEDWAKKYGYNDQAALVEALEADKSIVSRWYNGTSPSRPYQLKLAALFGFEGEPDIIFRHPDEDWLKRFFQDRSNDEIARMKQTLEAAFPAKKRA